MKITGIIVNVLLLIVVIGFVAEYEYEWPREIQYQLMYLVFFAAPLFNIFALSVGSTENWLALFLERNSKKKPN